MSINGTLLSAALGLTVGNFLYQAFTAGDYWTAFDRSFFQAGALLMVFLMTNWRQA